MLALTAYGAVCVFLLIHQLALMLWLVPGYTVSIFIAELTIKRLFYLP